MNFNQQISANKIVLLIAVSFLFTACYWIYSKDDYIQAYSDFVLEVNTEGIHYSPQDWIEADSIYHQYSVVEYERFKDDFHEIDVKAVAKLNALYSYLRMNAQAKELYKETIRILNEPK